jgi:hypothetical protein
VIDVRPKFEKALLEISTLGLLLKAKETLKAKNTITKQIR